MSERITRRLAIRGRVQGVGFRWALQRQAEALGLVGWVRNRADGSVEAVVQGPAAAVAAIERWARRGPPHASVSAVESQEAAGAGERFERFETRPSA